jgi:hypothetical protein
MKRYLLAVMLISSLLLTTNSALAYWNNGWGPINTYRGYAPGYYNPYIANPYGYSYTQPRPVAVTPPTNINSCPLQASYYDANGNWVAAKRVCPSTTPQVNIHIGH